MLRGSTLAFSVKLPTSPAYPGGRPSAGGSDTSMMIGRVLRRSPSPLLTP
jgi:hypothetical protein